MRKRENTGHTLTDALFLERPASLLGRPLVPKTAGPAQEGGELGMVSRERR